MNISIIGYGKMGQQIEKLLRERGHHISAIIDENNINDFESHLFQNSDVAIEFTSPEVAPDNYIKCFESGVSVVSGTTGWLHRQDEVFKSREEHKAGFFYASNFSLGVNLMFEMNRKMAALMHKYSEYIPALEEWHHIQKKDAPSGTARTLAEDLIVMYPGLKSWNCNTNAERELLNISAYREGEVFGIHSVKYESEIDWIELKHHAKNRSGFVQGAVLAAEFIAGKKGVYGMKDLLNV
jgi:4-hydroxy-tetrahydrodipicolinate reductase